MDDEAIDRAFESRRFPHGRYSSKGSKKAAFDVNRTINEYNVVVGSQKSRKRHGPSGDSDGSSLTVLGLAPDQDGLLAAINLHNAITGIAVLAGSRQGLQKIIRTLQEHTEDESAPDNSDDKDDADKSDTAENDDEETQMRQLNDRFEKNSFRNPKFWMRWRGAVQLIDSHRTESNNGYVVFSNNDCRTFEGTLTCEALGWDNVKLRGERVKAQARQTIDLDAARALWQDSRWNEDDGAVNQEHE